MDELVTPKKREDLAGKSPKEALEILKSEGVELTEEQLESVTGGDGWDANNFGFAECSSCHYPNYVEWPRTELNCSNCGAPIRIKW